MKGVNPFKKQAMSSLLRNQHKFVRGELKRARKASKNADIRVKYFDTQLVKIERQLGHKRKGRKNQPKQ